MPPSCPASRASRASLSSARLRPRAIRGVVSLLALLLTGYLAVVGGLWVKQESLLFHPDVLPADHRFNLPPDVHEASVDVPGARLNALHLRLPKPDGVVFYLHGNGGSLDSWFVNHAFYRDLNVDLFMIDYRGYGKSTGRNTDEAQMMADVQAAWRSIAPLYEGKPLVVFGRSLGTGLAATFTASLPPAQQPALLVLVSPYLSMRALTAELYPYVPSSLLRYPLHTDRALQALAGGRTRMLLLHGDNDALIPYAHSEALARLVPTATLRRVEGAGHGDISGFETYLKAVHDAIEATVRTHPLSTPQAPS
jgi:pimeloyl-ACP methyl ester carboxylesterase